jgi:two-component system sensor kinase FixL
MGVGLSISRTIIDTHGGRMWAETNEAGGATFRFTLPAASTKEVTNVAER